MPSLSVLIVNYNGLKHLPDCLGSLYDQLRARNLPQGAHCGETEVIVVDNASADTSRAWIHEHFPEVHIIESERNLGFAGGNNLGLSHCHGEWIFLLNNDTVLEPGCILAIWEAIHENAGDILACLMTDFYHPDRIDSAGDFFYRFGPTFSRRGLPVDHPALQQRAPVFSACAGACVIRREVFRRIGTFDEDLFLNFEDMDLCMRARHAGYRITLIPAARVRHKGSATIGRYTRTSVYYSVRNQFLVRLKNYPASVLWRCFPGLLFTGFLSLIKTTWRGGGIWWLEARWHQILMIPGFLRKRKAVLSHSVWNSRDFYRWLRPGWWQDYWRRQLRQPLNP